jgi:2-iminobutanoate/2-iminopropanoate deaminase
MPLKKTIIEPSWEAKYSFSPAVITEGGKTIWLAGHVGFVDDAGASLAGNFDAQVRQAFKNLEKTSEDVEADAEREIGDEQAGKRQHDADRKPVAHPDRALQRAGGTLKDIVWMTVAVSDGRYAQRFTDMRKEILRNRFSGEHLAHGGELCRAGDHGGDHADRGRRRIASWQIAAHSALNHDCLKLNCCGKRFNTKQPCSSRPVRSAKSAL